MSTDTLVNLLNPTGGKAPPDKGIGDFSGEKPCNFAGFRRSNPAENVEFRQYHRVITTQILRFFQKKNVKSTKALYHVRLRDS